MSQDYDDYGDERESGDDGEREGPGRRDAAEEAAMQRTSVPGILFIVVGVLNLLISAYFVFNGAVAMTPTGKQMAKFQIEQNAEQKKQFDQMGWDLDQFINIIGLSEVIVAGLGILFAILTIVAGARMRALSGYGLAVVCSIVLCIPFLSPLGCCIFGQVVGILSLVVLLSPDVKSAFR